jgi:hypothetical protein
MLGNAVWYGGNSESVKSGFQFGFINISSEEVITGLMLNLLTFPIIFLIVFLFKYSKPRSLRENRILRAMMENNNDQDIQSISDDTSSDTESRQASTRSVPSTSYSPLQEKFSLPFFCSYIGWFLALFSIAVSIFFLWAYGIAFGNDQVFKWLTSFVISFFTSFLIFEPIKVCKTECSMQI